MRAGQAAPLQLARRRVGLQRRRAAGDGARQAETQARDAAGVREALGDAPAVVAVLEKNKLAGQIPVTGQDATDEGLQRVLLGTQCMTVYKAIKAEADAAAKLAIALSKGETPAVTGKTADSVTGKDVPSELLVPVGIFPETVKDVVADGFTTADKLCTTPELKAACTKYGVS